MFTNFWLANSKLDVLWTLAILLAIEFILISLNAFRILNYTLAFK